MRLHHLTITAFGPFPGTETVDFDELHEAGLFLLTGPTGAGKTSILDAVCFALYGSVPGARGVKALKSQHAGVYDGPEVVLDFSVRERRFVVRRTPEWSRPKKRGEGIATEKASASLVETTSGEDHFLTSRAAEVGLMISELVGMQASQFVQVAMLPQGEFQTFLRASSQERHDVLQHLFRTDRFARIEGWVHDHSRRLRERAEGGQSSVQRILDTMADRAGVTLPDDLAGDALATGEPERPRSWATDLREAAREQRLLARRAHEGAAAAALTARAAHDDAVRRHALHRRRADAESALDALAEGDAAEAAARATLESGERASGCLPVLRLLDDARAQLDHATSARDDALDRLRAHRSPGPVLPDDLADLTGAVAEQAEQDLRAQITRVEALVPRERARAEAAGAMTRAHAEIEDAETELHRAEARRTAIPLERARLRKDHDRAARDAARAEALRLELDAARARSTAAAQVPAAEAELVRLQDRHRDARDAAADAREHVLTLATRRLDGMAAELATTLTEGAACQVCGSLEHPAPARPTDDAVTDVEQDLAAGASDAAGTALDAATQRVSGAGRSLDALRQGADGLDAETASLRVSDLEAALAAAEDAADARDAIDHSLEELEAEEEQVRAGTQDLQRTVGSLRQTLAGHLATVESALRDIAVVLPDADATLEDRLAELRAGLDRVLGARRAVQTHEQARGRVHDLEQQVEATTTDRGFDSPDHARRAVLPDAERLGLEELLEERGAATARTRAVLADPDVAGATAVPAELLAELDAAVRSTQQADEAAARSHHQQDQLVDSLESNLVRLDDATAAWAPLRDDHVRAESMSKLVRGMGHDNHLQMRLSAYVLATRLDQVVAAANERLGQMRDRRYLLQRTGRAARKGSQAGLGLEVVDQWTGEVREPTTLSGGETFVVSLSLALGLADVVTQESGGTEIETLFVDEGFGTLDADTLDDVMDRLDGLRVGGRAVGVVSHVSELRNRIPTQVHVEKTRTGSSIAVHTLVG